jgi:hypothetical protein
VEIGLAPAQPKRHLLYGSSEQSTAYKQKACDWSVFITP